MGKPLREYTDKQLATVIGVVLTEKSHLRNITLELIGLGMAHGFWGTLKKKIRALWRML